MKMTYDKETDYAYLQLVHVINAGESVRQEVVYVSVDPTCDCKTRVIIDIDINNKIIGFEFEDGEAILRQSTLGLT